MREKGEIKFWFTTKTGRHVPVYEGETKADVVKRLKERASKSEQKSMKETAQKAKKKEENKAPEVKSVATSDKKESDIEKAQERAKKLNAEEQHRDTLKQDNKVTRTKGKMHFKGKEVQELDTKDAGYINVTNDKGEVYDKVKDSLSAHLDNNGKLSSERQKVHAEIIEQYFEGHKPLAPGEEKIAYFTGGGGASGKGQFSGEKGANVEKWYSQKNNPLIIDPDELKKNLAHADGKELDAWLTGYYHEESSALAKQIYATALQHGYPVMYDGTATGGGIYKLLDSAKESGYKTEMNFLFSDWNTVRANSLARYEKTGRFVPPEQVFNAHQKAFSSVQKLKDSVDSFTLFDNAGRKMRKVAEGGTGKAFKILNQNSYDRFSKSKAEFTLSEDAIRAYMDDADKITATLEKKIKNSK